VGCRGGFRFGGEPFQFFAMDECVAGRADEEPWRQLRATLCAGHIAKKRGGQVWRTGDGGGALPVSNGPET
jgi:hypothetical protein